MNRKRNYIKTAAVTLLMVTGLLGCSSKDTLQPQDEQQETMQMQETEQTKEGQQESTQPGISDAESIAQTADSAENSTEKGFETPEAAVMAYLAGLRDDDFVRMVDTFGEGSGAGKIPFQYSLLCGIDMIAEANSGNIVRLNDSEEVEKFLEQLTQKIEAADFGSMEFIGFVPPEELIDTYSSDEHQEKLLAIAQRNGGSELESRMAVIQVNENQYILLLDVIKRDGRWYLFELGGNLAGELEPALMKSAGGQMNEEVQRARIQLLYGIIELSEEDTKMLKQFLSDVPESLPEAEIGAQAIWVEGEGFDTPQQAGASYLEGLKAHDMDQMMSTFSVESYAEHYNMQAELEWLQCYVFAQPDVTLPPVNDFTKAMISYERKKQLKEDILNQGNALYQWREFLNDSKSEFDDVLLEWEELAEKTELYSIEILGYIPPEALSESYLSDSMLDILKRQAEIYGADKVENCVIVFECDGDQYCLFTEAVDYGGKWYNSKLGNQVEMLLGISTVFVGTEPIEMISAQETVENLIIPIEKAGK